MENLGWFCAKVKLQRNGTKAPQVFHSRWLPC